MPSAIRGPQITPVNFPPPISSELAGAPGAPGGPGAVGASRGLTEESVSPSVDVSADALATEAVADQNQVVTPGRADFSPTDAQVAFGAPQTPQASLTVSPPAEDLPQLQNGRSVLRGADLEGRLDLLSQQATQGAKDLSDRRASLEQDLACFAEDSPQYQEIQSTMQGIDQAVKQLNEVQQLLSDQSDPQAVAKLQALLVDKDNGKAEEKPFKERLSYEKPDGSTATFDNLYGKRTDAGLRDYIGRLVQETRATGPHAEHPDVPADAVPDTVTETPADVDPNATSDIAPASDGVEQGVAETEVVAQTAATPVHTEDLTFPDAGPLLEPSVEASAELAAAETEPFIPTTEGVQATAETTVMPEAGEDTAAFDQIEQLLNQDGDIIAQATMYKLKLREIQDTGQMDKVETLVPQVQAFVTTHEAVIQNFAELYEKLDSTQREAVDQRLVQDEIPQLLEVNPELSQISFEASGEEARMELAGLWRDDSSMMFPFWGQEQSPIMMA